MATDTDDLLGAKGVCRELTECAPVGYGEVHTAEPPASHQLDVMREDAATAELTRDGADECLNFLYRGVGLAYMYAPDAETEEVSDAQGFAYITERGRCDGDDLLGQHKGYLW